MQYCRPDKQYSTVVQYYNTIQYFVVWPTVLLFLNGPFVRPTVLHFHFISPVCPAYSIAFVQPTVLRLSVVRIFTEKPYFFYPTQNFIRKTNRAIIKIVTKKQDTRNYQKVNLPKLQLAQLGFFCRLTLVHLIQCGQSYKTFYGRNLRIFVISQSICPWQAFLAQSNATPRANPTTEHMKCASLGQAPALPANIRLGLKGLPCTNTLAYYKNP